MPWPPPGPGGVAPGGPYQSGPGHRKPKKKVGLVVLALVLPVVLIAAIAGGMYYFQLGPFGSKISADRKLQYVLQERLPASYKPKEGSDLLAGRWWTDKYLVRAMPDQIVGYDLAAGKPAYTVDTPDNHVCKASGQQSSNGYIAVLRGTRSDGCRQVTVVDIANGKVVWSKNLRPVGAPRPDVTGTQYFPRYDQQPEILGDRLYIPTDKGTHVLKVSDGSTLETPPKSKEGVCFTTHVDVIGETGLAYRNCSPHGGDKDRHLTAFNAVGKTLWTWKLPVSGRHSSLLTGVLSTDPLLVRAFGQGQSQILRVDPKTGKHNVVVDLTNRTPRGPAPSDPCDIAGGDGLHDCSRQAVSNGVLYLRFGQGQGTGLRRGIAAYDVQSGNQLWMREWGEGHHVTAPLGLDGNGAPIVYLIPKEKDPGALVRVDPRTGAMTAIATLPPASKSATRSGSSLIESPDQGAVAWRNDYLAFLKVHITSRDAGYAATILLK
jgi:outer membrane protein assembly factor BamB